MTILVVEDEHRIAAFVRKGLEARGYDAETVGTQPLRFFVTEYVREAAFALLEDELPYAVAAEVEEFWLDAVGRSASTRYIGRVAIAIVIADAHTGQRLVGRRYVGIRRRTADADATEAWREVMDTALARTIHDLATDPDIALSLGRPPL